MTHEEILAECPELRKCESNWYYIPHPDDWWSIPKECALSLAQSRKEARELRDQLSKLTERRKEEQDVIDAAIADATCDCSEALCEHYFDLDNKAEKLISIQVESVPVVKFLEEHRSTQHG